jgi:hypothetical protein
MVKIHLAENDTSQNIVAAMGMGDAKIFSRLSWACKVCGGSISVTTARCTNDDCNAFAAFLGDSERETEQNQRLANWVRRDDGSWGPPPQ